MKRFQKRVCVLASSGVDSSVLVSEMLAKGYRVTPLYVRSGFTWEKAELFWLRKILASLKNPRLEPLVIADAPMAALMRPHWGFSRRGVPGRRSAWEAVYLPGRNLILLGQAGVLCAERGITRIAMAILKGNPFSDATPAFLKSMQKSINLATGAGLTVSFPYANLTKEKVTARAKGFPLALTFSCLNPRGTRPCGRCGKCAERDAVISREER